MVNFKHIDKDNKVEFRDDSNSKWKSIMQETKQRFDEIWSEIK